MPLFWGFIMKRFNKLFAVKFRTFIKKWFSFGLMFPNVRINVMLLKSGCAYLQTVFACFMDED